MPRPGTPVVHPRMLEHLRPTIVATMAHTAELARPTSPTGAGAFDPETGTYPAAEPTALWSGPCRVQPLSRSGIATPEAGGDLVTTVDYQVTVPFDAPRAQVDDLLTITAGPDPQLLTRTFRVTDAAVGDLQLERHLLCQLDGG